MNWKTKLTTELEPDLVATDSAYRLGRYHHDVPCAIFPYPASSEIDLREELRLLVIRLTQAGKRVHVVSLAECLIEAVDSQGRDELIEAESYDSARILETLGQLLSEVEPLSKLIQKRLPTIPDAARDVVLLVRAASVYKIHRVSALLEQMKATLNCPTVLFYPGELEKPIGLRFLGRMDADNSYRYKIY